MTQLSRSTFRMLLNNTVDVYRVSHVSDGMGGSTLTETKRDTLRARMRPLNPQEMETAARMDVSWTHILYVEAPYEFNATTDFVLFRGERYRVIETQNPGYEDFHLQVFLRREV